MPTTHGGGVGCGGGACWCPAVASSGRECGNDSQPGRSCVATASASQSSMASPQSPPPHLCHHLTLRPPRCARQVASYEFTTLTCIPGIIRYRGAKIQLLDLPGIIEGAKDGKGRGRQVGAGRAADTVQLCRLQRPGCNPKPAGRAGANPPSLQPRLAICPPHRILHLIPSPH